MSPSSDLITAGGVPPVLPTKLRKPILSGCLRRDRLFQRLEAATRTPLVVVHADAGYGKTTLVASYLQERSRTAIWYYLGPTDRLKGTLVVHIRHAVAEAFPAVLEDGPDPLQMMDDPDVAGVALAALMGRAGASITLVLDDYSRVEDDSEIHRLVQSMVEHLPSGIQMFLLSRKRPPLPLARFEIEGRVLVLTKAELAFTRKETLALFRRTYNRSLTSDEVDLVERRLEGWAAGLRMTNEALKTMTEQERKRFWTSFSESPAIMDYLAEEVLSALPSATLNFLFQTSILSVLSPEFVEEMLPGCGAASTLERLARENLFTTALIGAGTHYRYHNLFRRFLCRRLKDAAGAEGMRQLHIRTADLYARRDEIDYAIGHSLAAGEYQRVVRLLERLAKRHRADVLLRLMEGWLERVFPDMEGICGVALRRLMPISVYELVLPGLRMVAEGPQVDPVSQAYAQQRLGTYFYYRGHLEESLIWMKRSRDNFYQAGRLVPASYSSALLALSYLFKGVPEQAEGPVNDALEWARGESNYPTMNALWAKAELALARQSFQEAEEAARTSIDRDVPYPFISSFNYSTLAVALLYQDRFDEAMAACSRALTLARQFGAPTDLGWVHMRIGIILGSTGNLDGARKAAEKAVDFLGGLDFLLARALLARADLAVAAGDSDAARLWVETREFWDSRSYLMHPVYDGITAPNLLGLAGRLKRPVRGCTFTGPQFAEQFRRDSTGGRGKTESAPLVISTMGSFRVRVQERDSDPAKWGRTSSCRLFFYLLLHRGHMVHRDQIMEALWPCQNPTTSVNRLWVAIHVLRKALDPLSSVIQRQGQMYCLRLPPGTDLDLDNYLELAEDGLARGDQTILREAAELYRGDFLEEYPYDQIIEAERSRLRELQKRVVIALADAASSEKDYDSALAWYREARRLDHLLEKPVLRIIEILLARGEAGAVIEIYRVFRTAMRRELGLGPTDELYALYRKAFECSRQTRFRDKG